MGILNIFSAYEKGLRSMTGNISDKIMIRSLEEEYGINDKYIGKSVRIKILSDLS